MELSPKTWVFLGLSGLVTGASWVCYLCALKIGNASKGVSVDKLSLVLEAVFAFTFFGPTSDVPGVVRYCDAGWWCSVTRVHLCAMVTRL